MTLRAVGVHVFMGGFSLGVEHHFRVLAHLESSKFGVASFQRNRPRTPVYIDKDRKWRDFETWGGRDVGKGSSIDLVFSNPPCSGFSPMTEQKFRGPESHLNSGIRDVVRVGKALGAGVIAVESVRSMGSIGLPLLNQLWDEVRDDYPASFLVNVNAVNHQVCQWRPRTFWLLSQTAGWRPRWDDSPGPSLTEAISGIPESAPNQEPLEGLLRENEASLFPLLAPGQRVDAIPMGTLEKLSPYYADRTKRWSMAPRAHWARRVNPEKMSGTIYGNELKYVHPRENRLLTIREVARLMGIPDDFEIAGPPGGKQMVQMSKGICPPVGRWLAREIAAFLGGDRAPVASPKLVVYDDEPRRVQGRPWPER